MYYEHFGLTRPPFNITPDTQLFFGGGRRGDTLEALIYAVVHGEGIVKVVGEVGSGKTMLCRMLESKLPKSVDVVYLSNPHIAPEDVPYAIATEIKLSSAQRASRFEILNALQHELLARHAAGRHVVVFVEEAQGMPLDTLEEIRLLNNLETERYKLLQIVLFGQPELDTLLADPCIRQLRERITHSFHLGPLEAGVIREYVEHRMRAAGYQGPPAFGDDALRVLVRASRGWMRRINILCDKALLATFASNGRMVRAEHMRAAVNDSEFRNDAAAAKFSRATLTRAAMVGALGILGLAVALPWKWESAPAPDALAVAARVVEVPPSRPVDSLETDLVQQQLARTRLWLRAADAQGFSIQVFQVNADSVGDLETFLRKPEMSTKLDKIFVYPARVKGRLIYGVIYNVYEDRAQAMAALKSLAPEFKRYQPVVRSIQQLRTAVEESGAA